MRTCVWLTGLPGVGKTTLANEIKKLRPEAQFMDGEDMRETFWPQLGVVHGDRIKNVARIGALAAMVMEHGGDVVVSCVSPDVKARQVIREKLEQIGRFRSVRLHCKVQRKKLHPNTEYEIGDHDLELDTGRGEPQVRAVLVAHQYLPRAPRALFVGRWQPFHAGHQVIIREALATGPVAIGVRITEESTDNPHSLQARIQGIQKIFKDDDVVVFAVPDIHSIHIGRDVGYEVHRDVEGISGTDERRKARE